MKVSSKEKTWKIYDADLSGIIGDDDKDYVRIESASGAVFCSPNIFITVGYCPEEKDPAKIFQKAGYFLNHPK